MKDISNNTCHELSRTNDIKPSVIEQLEKIASNFYDLYKYEKHVDPNGEDIKFYEEMHNRIDEKAGELWKRSQV